MKKKTLRRIAFLVVFTLLIPTVTVLAEDNAPENPGVGGGSQTVIRTESAMWVLPHGDTFFISGREVNIIDDWGLIAQSATFNKRGNGPVYFVEVDGLMDDGNGCVNGNCYPNCGLGGGAGACIPLTGEGGYENGCNGNGCGNNGNGNGNGNGNHDCGGPWVVPGNVSARGEQTAPAHAVVVGQDPDANGVTVYWNVQIEPTIVIYKDWQLMGHRHLACVEGDLDENGNGNIYDPGDEACPFGWHEAVQHIWGCVEEREFYREGIGDLSAEISLTAASRGWIQGELAVAYPGATLIKPDWSYSTTPTCAWTGDICNWDFTVKIPVADPGWYDIKVAGTTTGTNVYTPRGFELIAGELGVYLLDNTVMIQ